MSGLFHKISNTKREQQAFSARCLWLVMIVMITVCMLFARFVYLQIYEFHRYATLSDQNRIQRQPVSATRGLIYDRNKRVLADNITVYSLTIIQEHTKDLKQLLQHLQSFLEIDTDEIKAFWGRIQQRRIPFKPILLKEQLSAEEIARVVVNRYFLPGVHIQAEVKRHYPQAELTAHVLGYMGSMGMKELKAPQYKGYLSTARVGKFGIEKKYESLLHGQAGSKEVEINARGRILRTLSVQDAVPGKHTYLTIDLELQKIAYQRLNQFRGALVAIEIETGDILTLVSTPSYDPNQLMTVPAYARAVRSDKNKPLFNRAVRGKYPPGSVLKPFIALALLEASLIDWEMTIDDPGYYEIEVRDEEQKHIYRDWKKKGHGIVDLRKAIVESCDTFFYTHTYSAEVDRLSQFLKQFGFGQNFVVDIDHAAHGLLPTRAWKKATFGESWYPGDNLNLSIGQGYIQTTALQLATATALLAAEGQAYTPRLVLKETAGERRKLQIELSDQQHWQRMNQAVTDVVMTYAGTAARLKSTLKYPMAGKTGTAQVVSIKEDEEYDSDSLEEHQKDHALFIAFAPVKRPRIAVAVIVENAESAPRIAAPMAKAVIEHYLDNNRL